MPQQDLVANLSNPYPVQNTSGKCAGLSEFFGIPLVPGLVYSQVGKSEEVVVKSRLYSSPKN